MNCVTNRRFRRQASPANCIRSKSDIFSTAAKCKAVPKQRIAVVLFAALVLLVGSLPSLGSAQSTIPIQVDGALVFLGLTEESRVDDTSFVSVPSASAAGASLPLDDTPHYALAAYDTATPVVILNADDFTGFGITAAAKDGRNATQVGFGGGIEAISSDPLGAYVTGLQAITTASPLAVDRSTLAGAYNTSVLYTDSREHLSVVGSSIAGQYSTLIPNSNPRSVELDGMEYFSPTVALQEFGQVVAPERRIALTIIAGQFGSVPSFLPDLNNINLLNLADNPSSPTIGNSFSVSATVANGDAQPVAISLAVSTGLGATILSPDVAVQLGIDLENDEPDFVYDLQAIDGTTEAKGFYIDEFAFSDSGGNLILHEVPVFVSADVDQDGFFGMNLLWNRDWVIHPEPGNSYLGFGEVITDPSDLDSVCRQVAAGETSAEAFTTLLSELGVVQGDANQNGQVEFADFLTLSANFGTSGHSFSGGDFDCDGVVAFSDFLKLSANFGASTQVMAVPEPNGASWLSVAIAGLLIYTFGKTQGRNAPPNLTSSRRRERSVDHR